jgi:hypothetical protein
VSRTRDSGILNTGRANDILQEVCLKILRFAHKYDRQIVTVGIWFALITDNVVYQPRLKYRWLSNYRFFSVDEKYEFTSEDWFECVEICTADGTSTMDPTFTWINTTR